MLNEIQVGPQQVSSGARTAARGGFSGEALTAEAHARFQEAVLRGACFISSDQATGGRMPAGLSTAPITVSLYNPKGSQKLAVIWYASLTNKVAPAAASVVWIGANINVAANAVTGTAATVQNCQIGNTVPASVQAFTTATLPAAPIAVLTLGVVLTGDVAVVQPQAKSLGGWIEGALIMLPGSALSFQASTQGGLAGSHGSWIWEEVPLLS